MSGLNEKTYPDIVKTRVAEALSPMLDVFHSIGEAPLHLVRYVYAEGCLERIVLSFGRTSLVALADEDDDTIVLWTASTESLEISAEVDMRLATTLWEPFVGKQFGWGYVVVNQQGYCDGLLLGFADIRPKVFLQVVASSIEVRSISEARPDGLGPADTPVLNTGQ